ncbi:MAG: formylglycine-generating enzyme family protein [Gammaproteobacteria bacterium]|nr:formylglycine-generating enzyme family protein [Gammaproteobacteria bacterium]
MFSFCFRRIGVLLFLVSPPLWGGSLEPPAGPDDPASAMYSVETVYQRLATGAAGEKRAFGGPSGDPGSTGHTLNDVMTAAPVADNVNGMRPEEAPCGKTFWSLRTDGSWGQRTGTAGCGGSPSPATGAFRDTLVGGGQGPLAMWLPGSTFRMGDIQGRGGHSEEHPVHSVTLTRFAMGVYEVTNAEYVTFLNSVKRRGTAEEPWFYTKAESSYSHITGTSGAFQAEAGYENHPVASVSWYGAVAYTEWLSAQTGKNYRLPTEAEWEYAARAGTETAYWWGNDLGTDNANCHADYCGDSFSQTAPAGSFAANPFGLHDTTGNVREWTGDWYDSGYYAVSPALDPVGPVSGSERVMRGGSWPHVGRYARSAYRHRDSPDERRMYFGFRFARGQ